MFLSTAHVGFKAGGRETSGGDEGNGRLERKSGGLASAPECSMRNRKKEKGDRRKKGGVKRLEPKVSVSSALASPPGSWGIGERGGMGRRNRARNPPSG